ncbi:MAG: hypothetical protein AAGE80_02710 [Pseudomonadota bacterium]
MRAHLLIALTFSLIALPVLSEPDIRRIEGARITETRFGEIVQVEAYTPVGKGFYRQFLSIGGRLLRDLYRGSRPVHVFNWGDKGDVVLIHQWSGGASCCSDWFFLHLSKDKFELKGPFADHGYNPSEFRVHPDHVSFRMERSYPASVDHWIVTYDGRDADITIVYESEAGASPAGAGEDVTRWNGSYPFSILEDPSERLRFLSVMNREEMDMLRTSLSIASPNKTSIHDGFLVGAGCWPRRCGEWSGFLAIELATGAPFAALLRCETLETYGLEGEGTMPAPLLAMIANERSRRAKSWERNPRLRKCYSEER